MSLSSILHRAGLAVLAALAVVPTVGWAQGAYSYASRYDLDRRVTGTIAPDPDGAAPLGRPATRNSYDARGLLVKAESGTLTTWQDETVAPANWAGFAVQRVVDSDYDVAGRKVRERVTGGGVLTAVTQYSHDAMDRVVCTAQRMDPSIWLGQTDACAPQLGGPNGPDRITRNLYDAAGQLLQVRRAVGTPLEQAYATYAYSPNGKRTAVVDANGNRAELGYDGFDRQNRWTFPGTAALGESQRVAFTAAAPVDALALSLAPNPSDFEFYTYDPNGNRTSLRKRDGSVLTYDYDALNRMTLKVVPERNGTPAWATRDVHYGYDLLGRQLYARFDGSAPGNEGVTNGYDALGRLTSSEQRMDNVVRTLGYQYDLNGNRTRLTFPDNGVAFSYSYDGLDRMKGIDPGVVQGAGVLASIGYDTAGRRGSLGLGGGNTSSYGYDGIGRLTSLAHGFIGTTGSVTLGFGHNPASQIVTETRNNDAYAWTGDYNVTRAYAANGLNQYTSAGPASFSYDANGNLTSDGEVTYGYDVENRIISASGAKNATLKYDPLGRLYEVSGGATPTRFLYDTGMGAAAGVDALLAEYDATSGSLTRRYVHGPGLDEPLVWYEGSTLTNPRYLHANHQGSIIGIANASGQSTGTLTYDPYGIPGTQNFGRFQYTGQIWLNELGLYHYKARAYSPTLGRFLQTDPIGYDDQINLYAYVANDPVNKTDPDGKQSDSVMDRRMEAMRDLGKNCAGQGGACATTIAQGVAVGAVGAAVIVGVAVAAPEVAGTAVAGAARAATAAEGGVTAARPFAQGAGQVLRPTSAPRVTFSPKAPQAPSASPIAPRPQTGTARTVQPDKVPAEYRAAQAARAAEQRSGFWGAVADFVENLFGK